MKSVQACYRRQVAALLTDAPPDTEFGDGQRTYAKLEQPFQCRRIRYDVLATSFLTTIAAVGTNVATGD